MPRIVAIWLLTLSAWGCAFEDERPKRFVEPAKSVPIPHSPTFVKNSIGMKLAYVPAGICFLGGSFGLTGKKRVEMTEHYYLGAYEVTQAEYERVMGVNPSIYSRTGFASKSVQAIDDDELSNHPVENVSQLDAREFAKKLNQLENSNEWIYRLPTEIEWEYACRGGPLNFHVGSAFKYYTPEPTNSLKDVNKYPPPKARVPYRVGLLQPNQLGLYDMHGNVLEWCDDEVDSGIGKKFGVLRSTGGSFYPDLGETLGRMTMPPHARHDCYGFRIGKFRRQ